MSQARAEESRITQLLHHWRSGNEGAFAELLPEVIEELRRIAAVQMRREAHSHTLQPTALVNELCLRLLGKNSVIWRNREHFFGTAARMMRRILIDHARAKKARKRGGSSAPIPLPLDIAAPHAMTGIDLLALDQALERLREMDPDQARIVEMRFFAGLTLAEVADVLDVSPTTISRSWASARAWLYGELNADGRTES